VVKIDVAYQESDDVASNIDRVLKVLKGLKCLEARQNKKDLLNHRAQSEVEA
jgi:hypothetical protein